MPQIKPGHWQQRYWPEGYFDHKFSYFPCFIVGVKYDLAIEDLLKKKKLNVVHVSRIEFGLLVNSNFFYISSNIKVKEKLKQETIIEVKNIEEADLILIDEDVWLSEN